MVGEQVASQFLGAQKGPAPKAVQSFAHTYLKAKISYYKAWRGRKHAQNLIRGSPKESFYMFPSYFYMLEKVNLDIVNHIEVLRENRFKYLFLAFGATIRGFQYMQKFIDIDGTFFKGPYKGVMLVATTQSGNSKCYPIARGIVDSENEDSWTWFLRRLKEVIGDRDELVFISDRAQSIKKAISIVYERAQTWCMCVACYTECEE